MYVQYLRLVRYVVAKQLPAVNTAKDLCACSQQFLQASSLGCQCNCRGMRWQPARVFVSHRADGRQVRRLVGLGEAGGRTEVTSSLEVIPLPVPRMHGLNHLKRLLCTRVDE